MEWADPHWFWALLLVWALPLWRRTPALVFSAVGTLRRGQSLRLALAWIPDVLQLVGLTLLVVALARPQQVDRERVVESAGIDIMLVLDTSGSMEAEDYDLGGRSASRLSVAKEVLHRFVSNRPDDRVGLVVFGEEAFTQVPLTLDHDALLGFLGQVRLGMAGQRATAIGDALGVAGKRMKDLEAPSRVVVLLTDGRNNAGRSTPLQMAEACKALGLRVHTIGVGTVDGGRGGGLLGLFGGGRGSDLDERTLKAIATTTGGAYFRATDTEGLQKVYDTIDEMEPSTAKSKEFVHREELFFPFLLWGLICLACQMLLGESIFRRLP